MPPAIALTDAMTSEPGKGSVFNVCLPGGADT
jgi:hypothetical protein